MAGSPFPPLVADLFAHVLHNYLGFHVPGHQQGRGAWPAWREVLGDAVFSLDLTELPGLDNLQDPQGILKEAEAAAAACFGAEETFFLVNGATAGILAVLLATCRPGDRVLLPRTCHQSVLHGLILSGASPVYLPVAAHGLPGMLRTEELHTAWNATPEPVRLLILLHPSYYGLVGDIEAQVSLAHDRGSAVLVDEAHGAHFCTSASFPPPALRCGADFVAQGAHKSLGAFTQAAFLHCQGRHQDVVRIRQMLRMIQTSSPSYLLMASLDVARYQCQEDKTRWDDAVKSGIELRHQISRLPGLLAPSEELLEVPGVTAFDSTRLIVNVSGLAITGFAAAEWLRRERDILVELADLQNLLFVLGPGARGLEDALLEGLTALAAAFAGRTEDPSSGGGGSFPDPFTLSIPRQVLTPREAFFAPQETVSLRTASGRVAADVVAPYPPGVPLICPGEEITAPVLEFLTAWEQAGGVWPGQGQGMIRVVAEG